jgi:hypothetical protein
LLSPAWVIRPPVDALAHSGAAQLLKGIRPSYQQLVAIKQSEESFTPGAILRSEIVNLTSSIVRSAPTIKP